MNTPEVADLAQFEIISENNRTNLILLMLKLLRIDFTNNDKLITAAEYAGKQKNHRNNLIFISQREKPGHG